MSFQINLGSSGFWRLGLHVMVEFLVEFFPVLFCSFFLVSCLLITSSLLPFPAYFFPGSPVFHLLNCLSGPLFSSYSLSGRLFCFPTSVLRLLCSSYSLCSSQCFFSLKLFFSFCIACFLCFCFLLFSAFWWLPFVFPIDLSCVIKAHLLFFTLPAYWVSSVWVFTIIATHNNTLEKL